MKTLPSLIDRLGEEHVSRRMALQAHYVARIFGPGLTHVHIENMHWVHYLIRRFLQVFGLYRRGQSNALDFRIVHNFVHMPSLPPAFRGFRILHLSDLHADFHPDFAPRLIRALDTLDYDLAVLTGDYRMQTIGNYEPAMNALRAIVESLKAPVFAILGNHDFLEMTDELEHMGAKVLLNEHAWITRGNEKIHLAGVDDPHFYQAADIARAAKAMPSDAASILLIHSPELYQQAEQHGFKLMLCGHTHGGQICLPGGFAPLKNARAPRRICRGAWRYGAMQAYTSRGTGASGVDVRFNCPPEIVLHHLSDIPMRMG